MAPTSFLESRSSFPIVRRRRDCTTLYSLVVLSFFVPFVAFLAGGRGDDPFSLSIIRLEYFILAPLVFLFSPSYLFFSPISQSTVSIRLRQSSLRVIYIRQYSWSREIKVRIGDSIRRRCVSEVERRW